MKIMTLFLSFLTVLLTACGSPVQDSNNLPERVGDEPATTSDSGDSTTGDTSGEHQQDTTSLNGTWILVPILASDTAAGKVPTINFNLPAQQFTGNTGCNSMRGTFGFTDSALKINEQIVTTKMACPGYNEDAFLKNLSRTNGHKFEKGMLILLINGAEGSRWTRTKVKPDVIKSI